MIKARITDDFKVHILRHFKLRLQIYLRPTDMNIRVPVGVFLLRGVQSLHRYITTLQKKVNIADDNPDKHVLKLSRTQVV